MSHGVDAFAALFVCPSRKGSAIHTNLSAMPLHCNDAAVILFCADGIGQEHMVFGMNERRAIKKGNNLQHMHMRMNIIYNKISRVCITPVVHCHVTTGISYCCHCRRFALRCIAASLVAVFLNMSPQAFLTVVIAGVGVVARLTWIRCRYSF